MRRCADAGHLKVVRKAGGHRFVGDADLALFALEQAKNADGTLLDVKCRELRSSYHGL